MRTFTVNVLAAFQLLAGDYLTTDDKELMKNGIGQDGTFNRRRFCWNCTELNYIGYVAEAGLFCRIQHPLQKPWMLSTGENEAPEEMGPAKGIAGSHLPVAPEKLVSHQETHTQTKDHITGQSLTKAKPQELKDTSMI